MAPAQHGFNIIEIMVTLTVLAVLITLGAPSFAEWLQSQRIRASAEAIVNGMQVARGEAIRRNLPVKLVLDPPSAGWWVCESTIDPCDSTTLPADIVQAKSGQESSGNAIVKPTPDGAIAVTFSPLGSVVDNLDRSDRLTQVDVNYPLPAVCSADGGSMRCLRVVVTAGGSIRMCDPTPGIAAPDPRACP
jgi:type IV fimbrial biogenesis protein FimT